MARVGIIGVPSDSAGTSGGVALAPRVLRGAGLVDALAHRADVADLGDVALPAPVPGRDEDTGLIDPRMFLAVVENVTQAVASVVADGAFPLVIGGDCPLLLGCVAGSGAAGLLFVDGHEDAYTPSNSTTGETADMELGYLLGLTPPPEGMHVRTLPLTSVAVLGPRDGHLLRDEGVASIREGLSFADDTELRVDPALMTERALATIPGPVWFHLDLDVLSTEALVSVDYPQPGGIGWLDLMEVTRVALESGPVGWDVTIYNPDLDPGGRDARRIVRFLADAIELI